jgi:hypothetical protein
LRQDPHVDRLSFDANPDPDSDLDCETYGSACRSGTYSFDANTDPDSDLDWHQNGNSHPDPDQHQNDADPQHC